MYNPAAVETVSGTVESVTQTPGQGAAYGVHFTLKTDKETIPVHLGPGWYMDKQEVKPAAGDKVEVTGSRVTYEGKPAIIAGQVKKDGKVLNLRDANGVPAWAGKGAAGQQVTIPAPFYAKRGRLRQPSPLPLPSSVYARLQALPFGRGQARM
jgi:hypothetical protein